MRLGKGFQRAWTFLQSKSKLGKRENQIARLTRFYTRSGFIQRISGEGQFVSCRPSFVSQFENGVTVSVTKEILITQLTHTSTSELAVATHVLYEQYHCSIIILIISFSHFYAVHHVDKKLVQINLEYALAAAWNRNRKEMTFIAISQQNLSAK